MTASAIRTWPAASPAVGTSRPKSEICDGLIVKHQHETGTAYEPLNGEDDVSCGFASPPRTLASVSPAAVNGWHKHPTVTLNATDPDADIDITQYRVDGASNWTTYAGPFPVSGNGNHKVEYRSTDKAEHIEATRSLDLKIDATGPVISGMPPSACTIRAPNGWFIPIALVRASDGLSGLTPGSLKIEVTSNQKVKPLDIIVFEGLVIVRASQTGNANRIYTVVATASDRAGNVTTSTGTCVVPRNR